MSSWFSFSSGFFGNKKNELETETITSIVKPQTKNNDTARDHFQERMRSGDEKEAEEIIMSISENVHEKEIFVQHASLPISCSSATGTTQSESYKNNENYDLGVDMFLSSATEVDSNGSGDGLGQQSQHQEQRINSSSSSSSSGAKEPHLSTGRIDHLCNPTGNVNYFQQVSAAATGMLCLSSISADETKDFANAESRLKTLCAAMGFQAK